MRFGDELVDAGAFSFPESEGVRPQELQMAEQLIGNLTEPFDASKYQDDYRNNLMRIIKAKLKGKKVEAAEPSEPEATPVVDLMARLQESLSQGKPKTRPEHKEPARARASRSRRKTA
jgi:DNA end-binding protein Ku